MPHPPCIQLFILIQYRGSVHSGDWKNVMGRVTIQSALVCLWHLYSRFYMKLWNYFWSTYVGMTGLLKKKELIVPAGHSFFTIFHALHWLLRAQNIHQRTFSGIEINQRPSVSSLFPVIYNEQLKMVTLFPSLPASPANNTVSKLNVVFGRS